MQIILVEVESLMTLNTTPHLWLKGLIPVAHVTEATTLPTNDDV